VRDQVYVSFEIHVWGQLISARHARTAQREATIGLPFRLELWCIDSLPQRPGS
jgi:hypothetical protein